MIDLRLNDLLPLCGQSFHRLRDDNRNVSIDLEFKQMAIAGHDRVCLCSEHGRQHQIIRRIASDYRRDDRRLHHGSEGGIAVEDVADGQIPGFKLLRELGA